ncbi:MAG: GNAT family N-acetyltransferase [Rhodospirillales bacterium]|nr:GNAT family N-acetyltransferase [Rhodospirillales bacterium]
MIALRPARPGEGQVLYEITEASIRGLAASHYSPELIAEWMNGRDVALYEAAIAQGGVTIAVETAKTLGFVEAAQGEITRLFVRPEAAGQGLGRRLLEHGINMAGEGEIWLNATLNAALFYERCGFMPMGREIYRRDDGMKVEIVRMVRRTD